MKKIFIGCGSNPLISKEILDETKRVCEYFSKNDFELVYGSYDKGMMGICAHTFLENKKSVYGINLDKYPKSVIDTTQEEYHTSFDRLKRMYELADFFLILPGGTGTYSELFGIMEEFKTNKQDKKLFLYNYKGFYDELINFLEKNKNNHILYDDDLDNLIIVNTLDELKKEVEKNEI